MSAKMVSNIELVIDEIEDYIDGCKPQKLSPANIIVNKEEIDELLGELRRKTPEEIEKYRKIISNRDEIERDAKERAAAIINEATTKTNQLINEHEIMQQAYAQANEVVTLATRQAQEIVDNATIEANAVKDAAMEYLDNMLTHLDTIMTETMNATANHYESFINVLNGYHEIVVRDQATLHPISELIDEIENDSTDSNE